MADGVDPPVRFAIVHESARTRVTRLARADRTLIVKEPLGPDAGSRLRHETAILERLRGVTGVAQVADEPPREGSIVLADAGGRTLAELPKPLPAGDLAGLALRLALALAELHRREVIHRDLAPANVVVAADGTPTLVDFALAASIAEIRPGSHGWPRPACPTRRSEPGCSSARAPSSTTWARCSRSWASPRATSCNGRCPRPGSRFRSGPSPPQVRRPAQFVGGCIVRHIIPVRISSLIM